MPLDTFERSTPRLFNRGPTPLVRLLLATALGIFLIVADNRFRIGAKNNFGEFCRFIISFRIELFPDCFFGMAAVMPFKSCERSSTS